MRFEKMPWSGAEISLLRKLHNLLLKKKLSIAVTESCTGGELSSAFTHLPGSSAYFKIGIIPYQNSAKVYFGVSRNILRKYSPYSLQTVQSLADFLRREYKTAVNIAVSGIAGPGRNSSKNPIGTTYIAIAFPNKTFLYRKQYRGSRWAIRKKIVVDVIKILYSLLSDSK